MKQICSSNSPATLRHTAPDRRPRWSMWTAGACALLLAAPVMAQDDAAAELASPAPPSNLTASDHAWDNGTKVDLQWTLSPDDDRLDTYQIWAAVGAINGVPIAEPEFKLAGEVLQGTNMYMVTELRPHMDIHDLRQNLKDQLDVEALDAAGQRSFDPGYLFRVVAVAKDGQMSVPAQTTQPIVPLMQWYDGARFSLMWIVIIFCGAVIFWINHARRGKPIKVRKIGGLEAVDEAVGRATEMGRSCLFIPGIQDMNEIQTIAGITVLARVAKTAAEYDARVEVPTSRSLVMTACRETVQAAFLAAGRPDAYNNDLIYYVTDEQFGYVAYLQGMMVREKPAACFYMGAFYAESLILAETGNAIGAIQVAGTAQPAQLPFFVAACDYTLIGEEFFAASAYLSGSPEELGSLKGQDFGKLIVWFGLALGVLLATGAAVLYGTDLGDMLNTAVDFLKNTVLT